MRAQLATRQLEMIFTWVSQVVTSDTNLPLNMVDIVQEADREIVTVRMERQLAAGLKYKLSMKFRSYLNDELRGFYRSSYVENGATK